MHSSSLRHIGRRLSQHKRTRQIIIIAVLLLTVGLFINFFHGHPQYLHSLRRTNPGWIILVIGLNIPLLLTLVAIYDAILQLCGKSLPWRERFMLTSYSSIVNFFGPLQSGPGVRAVYLRTKHQVRIRDYTYGTLLYYGLFATISSLFLLVGTRPWWQTLLALVLIVSGSSLVIRTFGRRDRQADKSQFHLERRALIQLVLATALQVFLVSVTYFVELHAIDRHIHYGQAVSYAGAANFSLFVSLTPGAIGFRESFLYFSQQLHHVPTADIFSANLIDRGAYVIFLLLLFVLMLALHAGDKLQLAKLRRRDD